MLKSLNVCCSRVAVSKREGCTEIQAKGIFPRAKVVRGPDWEWENQDGVFIIAIKLRRVITSRSIAEQRKCRTIKTA